jgi:HSP20 family protein
MGLFSRKQKLELDGDDFPLAVKTSGRKPAAEQAPAAVDDAEGQLAVDVFQDNGSIVVRSTIAGVRPEDLDIGITSDMVTIRGRREREHRVEEKDFFFQECYWGSFSRSIILPCEVRADRAGASLKNGVLTITLPKVGSQRTVAVRVRAED